MHVIAYNQVGWKSGPKKMLAPDSSELLHYGEDSVEILLGHYGVEMPADTIDGGEYTTKALISSDIRTEWKTYRSYLSKQPKGSRTGGAASVVDGHVIDLVTHCLADQFIHAHVCNGTTVPVLGILTFFLLFVCHACCYKQIICRSTLV